MTPNASDVLTLRWHGIDVGAGWRSVCPVCSHRRQKRDERCLRVYPPGYHDQAVGGFYARCHHCQWDTFIPEE